MIPATQPSPERRSRTYRPSRLKNLCAKCRERPRRKGQRWCKECHAKYNREGYRPKVAAIIKKHLLAESAIQSDPPKGHALHLRPPPGLRFQLLRHPQAFPRFGERPLWLANRQEKG